MTMTDRELLERAAKAAGIALMVGPFLHNKGDGALCVGGNLWNPLTDDGDAFRLAMSLRINIEHMRTQSNRPHGVNCWPVGRGDCAHISNDLDEYVAGTRRAIVRAAAAMAKED